MVLRKSATAADSAEAVPVSEPLPLAYRRPKAAPHPVATVIDREASAPFAAVPRLAEVAAPSREGALREAAVLPAVVALRVPAFPQEAADQPEAALEFSEPCHLLPRQEPAVPSKAAPDRTWAVLRSKPAVVARVALVSRVPALVSRLAKELRSVTVVHSSIAALAPSRVALAPASERPASRPRLHPTPSAHLLVPPDLPSGPPTSASPAPAAPPVWPVPWAVPPREPRAKARLVVLVPSAVAKAELPAALSSARSAKPPVPAVLPLAPVPSAVL